MTTVGIMSMQRILNYGSSLQAYALRRLIEQVDGDAVVSYLDFMPGPPLVADTQRSRSSGVGRVLAKVREYSQTDASLVDKLRFLNHKRIYARKYFPQLGLPIDPSRDLDLDVQVIGSDEVFNCVQSNSNVGYSRDLFGHGSAAGRVISYAASFGNTTLEKIERFGIRADLEEDLARFSAISVRDRNSAQIVQELTGRSATVNVDPVLAFDLIGDGRVPDERQIDGRYLVVYAYPGRLDARENQQIRRFADARGLRVLTLGGAQPCGDRFIDCSPFEALAFVRDAEAVVTDTFHGTIFSIINSVPFATIVRPSDEGGYGNEEKLGFLLETFGVQTQRLADTVDLPSVLDRSIDFDAVHGILETERARAIEYLASAI